MMQKYTIDDLIRLIYKETDESEEKRIKYYIYKNPHFRDEYNSLKKICDSLDSLKCSPSNSIINKILQYSPN